VGAGVANGDGRGDGGGGGGGGGGGVGGGVVNVGVEGGGGLVGGVVNVGVEGETVRVTMRALFVGGEIAAAMGEAVAVTGVGKLDIAIEARRTLRRGVGACTCWLTGAGVQILLGCGFALLARMKCRIADLALSHSGPLAKTA
jgi:hypothetical protein